MSYTTILLRTVLSVVLGGIIGLERQSKHRPAGFRTHILVCLSSATIMMLSELMFLRYHDLYGVTTDPARMSAQVISGIGFLGAGTIIHSGANVRGLTTAASLWAVAAIGLTTGAGFIPLAVTVSAALYIALLTFNKISLRVDKQGNVIEMIVTLINKPETLGEISLMLAKSNVKILDMVFINPSLISDEESKADDLINVRIIMHLPDGAPNAEMLNSIRTISGVTDVERL